MPVLNRENCRIDEPSQRMLSNLVDGAEPVTELRDRTESGLEWKEVDYRLQKLQDCGWVEQTNDSPKTYQITQKGHDLVEKEGLNAPTLADVRELAIDAQDEAQSAKESVKSYRKKVSRLKNKVNNLETTAHRRYITPEHDRADSVLNHVDRLHKGQYDIRDDIQELEDQLDELDELDERVEYIASEAQTLTDDSKESFADHDKRLSDLETQSVQRQRQVSDLAEQLEEISERVDEIEKEQNKGIIRRFLPF